MDLLILILATWRLSSLLATEPGPFDVFARLRRLVGVRNDGGPYGTNVVSRAIICVWCVSVWIGAGWMAFYWIRSDYAFWAALPFALSGGAVLINEVIGWLEHQRPLS